MPATNVAASSDTTTSVIVGYRSADKTKAVKSATAKGAKIKKHSRSGRFTVVEVPKGQNTAEFCQKLADEEGVQYAEPENVYRAALTPNDPEFGKQWGIARIAAPTAWDVTQGSGVVVAVVDTGVELNHPDLVGRLDTANDYDFVNFDSNASDDNGHGTHVAGTVAANTNNTIGVTGVAGQATVLPVKVLNAKGEGSTSSVADGIVWAADKGAKVINLSLASPSTSDALNTAVQYAVNKDVVVVAATGNEGGAVSYPARLANVIGVGSTTTSDVRSSFSNFGPEVDVTAPGSGIYSTTLLGTYGAADGTSMAAPHAAGVVALIRAKNPSWTRTQVEQQLTTTAVDLGTAGKDNYFGHGRIRAAEAVGQSSPPLPEREADDNIPGVAAPASPITGNVNSVTDMDDVYALQLTKGYTLTVSLTAANSAADIRTLLFSPHDTDVINDSYIAGGGTGAYPRTFTYVAPMTGTYYLDAWAANGSSDYSISYSLTNDDNIPGVLLPTSPVAGSLQAGTSGTDRHDVYRLNLAAGQWAYFGLTAAAGTDFDLTLYGPGSATLSNGWVVTHSRTSGSSSERIMFQAYSAGTYYLDVSAASGAGHYTLTHGLPANKPGVGASAPSKLGFGKTATVKGRLLDQWGAKLSYRDVFLYRRAPGQTSWTYTGTTKTNYYGDYSFSQRPTSKTGYRVVFIGDALFQDAQSADRWVTPRAWVGTPIAKSTMSRKKYYTVRGSLKPRHTAGSYPVRIYKWKKTSSGKWKSYGYVKAKASNYYGYSKYSKSLRLRYAGKWRLRAYAPADSGHLAAWSSGYDYVTVK